MNLKVYEDSRDIRILLWIYFFLLMFEGVLRKWVLPGLSDPLLLVRDPFLMLIYILAFSRRIFPLNGFVITLGCIGATAVLLGMTVGSMNPLVTAYGLDSMFLHLPLIFIFPQVFNRNDVLKIGAAVLVLTVPMAILMTWQFRSPSDAWINCGAGGGVGAQIRGALGRIRPPGFFTFITGAAQFLALATAFLLYGLLRRGRYSIVLLLIAGAAVSISAVVSTSRLALGGIGLVFTMIGIIAAFDRKNMSSVLGLLIPIGLILVVVTNLDIYKEGREVFEARLDEAGDLGAGVGGTASNWASRFFGDFTGAFAAAQSAPLLGAGLGVGTNVGARILSGELGFLLAEGEWARVVLEIGPILALPYLTLRLVLCFYLFSAALKSVRESNPLPMLLFGDCVLLVLNGQFSQTNTFGFAVVGAGLCLAATNVPDVESPTETSPEEELSQTRARRGRSAYAAALHSTPQSQSHSSAS